MAELDRGCRGRRACQGEQPLRQSIASFGPHTELTLPLVHCAQASDAVRYSVLGLYDFTESRFQLSDMQASGGR